MAGAMLVQQCGVNRSAACRAQHRHSSPMAWSNSPSLSRSTRAAAGTLLSTPLIRLTGGMRTDGTPARRSAISASWDRKAQDTGRRVEGGAQEAGRKFESGAQEAKEKAPQQAKEASQEAKGTASRAGQEAQEQYEDPTERSKFVAEFSATALFTFLTATATAAATSLAGGNAVQALLWRMGAYAIIFPLIIYVFAPISKAHFNPMVTISMVVAGQQSLANGINYIIAQSFGAILGAALAYWALPSSQQNATYLGAAAVPAGRTVAQAFLGEVVGGAIFIYVLLATIVDPRGWGKLGPLSLGLTVPLLMWAVGPISSLSINPARALGPAVVAGVWQHHWLWWIAPSIGGAVAAKIYATFFLPTAKEA